MLGPTLSKAARLMEGAQAAHMLFSSFCQTKVIEDVFHDWRAVEQLGTGGTKTLTI